MQLHKPNISVMVIVAALAMMSIADAQPKATQKAAPPTAQQSATPEAIWPQRRQADGHTVLLYQPQIDSWENHARIVFRAVIAVLPSGQREYAYGVTEVEADTTTDVDKRTVLATNIQRQLRFPRASNDEAARLVSLVNTVFPPRESVVVPLDLVLASVRSTSAQQREVQVNLDPPKIFYSQQPAILLMFMGEPQLKPVQNTPLMFAINTNWDVFYEPETSRYFLLNGDSWLTTSAALKGPWSAATRLPKSFSALPDDANWAEAKKHIPGKPATRVPVVFASTAPAEMILVDGEPTYSPVPRTKLLSVSNTASIVFLHSGEKQYYYLVAGRWFRAKKLAGPWVVATTDLPQDFRQIPQDHPLAAVRASVPGTEEARDAVLLASVPTKAEVKVGQAPPDNVTYAGAPKFEPIPNTTVSYAVNTPQDVFVVEGRYYWVQQGVWYCSAAAPGPWTVCTAVPSQMYQIPATHPKHNVTYVYVYESTPNVVVTGYTSGYQGEYVAAGVLMFGAGMLVGAALANDNPYYYYGWPPPPALYSYGSGCYYNYRYGGYYGTAHAYGPYGSAGAWAGYNPATGTYARGGYAAGPYGAAGWGAAYNPYTGGRVVAGQVTTPYGSRGGYAAYNPYTGTASRGAYASGPRGSAYAQAGYNPYTGTSGARAGYSTAAGSGGRGYVQQGDEWARGGYRSTSQGTVAGVQTSRGAAAGVQTDQGRAAAARTASGDLYAGKDGTVYKKSEGGSWQQNTGSGWDTVDKPQPRSTNAASSAQRTRSSQPTTTDAATTARPETFGDTRSAGTAQSRSGSTSQVSQRAQGRQTSAAETTMGARSQAFGGSQLSGDMQSQLNRDAAARQRSERMSGGMGGFQGRAGGASGGASFGGSGGRRGGSRR